MYLQRGVTFATAAFVLCGAMPASANAQASSEWRWVRVEPPGPLGGKPFSVKQGTADVVFTGDHFAVTLREQPRIQCCGYRIEGTIRANEVVATEVQENTDAGLQTYHGTFRPGTLKWRQDQFTLQGAWGPFFVSLVRTLPPATGKP